VPVASWLAAASPDVRTVNGGAGCAIALAAVAPSGSTSVPGPSWHLQDGNAATRASASARLIMQHAGDVNLLDAGTYLMELRGAPNSCTPWPARPNANAAARPPMPPPAINAFSHIVRNCDRSGNAMLDGCQTLSRIRHLQTKYVPLPIKRVETGKPPVPVGRQQSVAAQGPNHQPSSIVRC
jgi:hypothetical protein